MIEKVGIITHYYNSVNYGGNLQAYALCRFICQTYHLAAEQICYDSSLHPHPNTAKEIGRRIISSAYHLTFDGIIKMIHRDQVQGVLKREDRLLQFNRNNIPHSLDIYNYENISAANDIYDCYITGSDQVWHPVPICPAYALSFAAFGKIKIAYAASVSAPELNEKAETLLRESLKSYKGISVREEQAVSMIQKITEVPVECCVDPTLLLNRSEWDEICSDRLVLAPYLFCYFLGENAESRKLAVEYAEQKGLILVTLPHLSGKFRKCDDGFGDIQLYDVGPKEFISLIKYADCVFTDSFHGTVFSLIYERAFFAFQRSGGSGKGMDCRLQQLTSLIHQEDRFCDEAGKLTAEYLNSVDKSGQQMNKEELNNLREKSMEFLKRNLL